MALALTVAACGADTASTTEAADQSGDTGSASVASDSTTAATEATAADSSSTEAAPAEAAGPSAPVGHTFPDLNTVNVADGSTINLAQELAGGDTPILLWFFAPH